MAITELLFYVPLSLFVLSFTGLIIILGVYLVKRSKGRRKTHQEVTSNPFPQKVISYFPSYKRDIIITCELCGRRFYEGDGVTCDNCLAEYCEECASDFAECSSCSKVLCPDCESELEENEFGESICSECINDNDTDDFGDYNEDHSDQWVDY